MFSLSRLKPFSAASVALVALLLAWPTSVQSSVVSKNFDAANQLYEQAKYAEAAESYEALLKKGVRAPAVYFNLGNAHFKAGHIGRAIAAFRRGEELSPRDPDIRANLRFARNRVQGPTLARGRLESWLATLSLNEWTMLAAAAAWLGFALLVSGQLRPALRAGLRPWLWAVAGAALLLAVCLAFSWHYQRGQSAAVVVADGTPIRRGPLQDSEPAFTLNDGAEVRVLDHKDDWIQVSPNSRLSGWTKSDKVLPLP